MPVLSLRAHPRLFTHPDMTSHIRANLHSRYLKQYAQDVLADADRLVKQRPLSWDDVKGPVFNTTPTIRTHLLCLLSAWVLTREARYRRAALDYFAALTAFPHICCEAHKSDPEEKPFFFCLSYAWFAVAAGYMYDLFREGMTAEEEAVILALLDKHLMKEALRCLEQPPWWAHKRWSNWNGVCSGGMGIMALAFHDVLPAARKLIPFVEKSLNEYLQSYVDNGGGCPEGTGYYNYGMWYAMGYLLCWQNATGRKHPALRIKELGKSLHFPIDFHRLTFGDNDGWHPSAYHFLLARQLNQPEAAFRAAGYLELPAGTGATRRRRGAGANTGELLFAADAIPTDRETADYRKRHARKQVPVARVYQGMAWGALADDEAFPVLRMTVRGGTTAAAGHAMQDQFSFKCMVRGECMITEQADRPRVSFTKRGNDVFGRAAGSKSSLFIDGLGCDLKAETDTSRVVKRGNVLGIRVEGARCFQPHWKDAFVGRLFLLVESRYWLVIDRAWWGRATEGYGMEARFHTFAESRQGRDWVSLKSGKERMTMTFASLEKAVLQRAVGLPTYPDRPTTLFRWMSKGTFNDNVLVAALHPGRSRLKLAVCREDRGRIAIEISEPGRRKQVIRIDRQAEIC